MHITMSLIHEFLDRTQDPETLREWIDLWESENPNWADTEPEDDGSDENSATWNRSVFGHE